MSGGGGSGGSGGGRGGRSRGCGVQPGVAVALRSEEARSRAAPKARGGAGGPATVAGRPGAGQRAGSGRLLSVPPGVGPLPRRQPPLGRTSPDHAVGSGGSRRGSCPVPAGGPSAPRSPCSRRSSGGRGERGPQPPRLCSGSRLSPFCSPSRRLSACPTAWGCALRPGDPPSMAHPLPEHTPRPAAAAEGDGGTGLSASRCPGLPVLLGPLWGSGASFTSGGKFHAGGALKFSFP